MKQRLTFLTHFLICLAVSAAAFFAWQAGAILTIWQNDQSYMTSVIAALFVGSSLYLAFKAWSIDNIAAIKSDVGRHAVGAVLIQHDDSGSAYGHLSERLAVMAGFVGTAIGLSLQAKALAAGATSFTALATSLFTTASGGTAAAILAIMTFNLEAGIRRVRR